MYTRETKDAVSIIHLRAVALTVGNEEGDSEKNRPDHVNNYKCFKPGAL
jgi:hypothetical protein